MIPFYYFMEEQNSIVRQQHNFFIHLLIDSQLDSTTEIFIVNRAAISIDVLVALWYVDFASFVHNQKWYIWVKC